MLAMNYIRRSVIRNVGRSILFVVASCSLLFFLGVYLSTIANNEQLLTRMGEKIPVTATITNSDGSQEVGLSILETHVDDFLLAGVINPLLTAESYGNVDQEKMNVGQGKISVNIVGTNTIGAFTFHDEDMQLSEPLSFLGGEEAKCLMDLAYVWEWGLHVETGSVLELNLFRAEYNKTGYSFTFVEVAPAQLIVSGFYDSRLGFGQGEAPDIICPVKWLRQQYEAAGAPFEFSSAKGTVAVPLLLNEFKAKAEAVHLRQADAQTSDGRMGSTLVVNDKMFIESASLIMRNLRMLNLFLIPITFFIFLLIALLSFFLTRSQKQEVSIAQCLGMKKTSLLFKIVFENCVLALIGGALAVVAMLLYAAITFLTSLLILLLFMSCVLVISFVSASLLTRMSPMAMLVRVD